MDFEENQNFTEPSQPVGPVPVPSEVEKPRKKRTGWKIFLGIFTGLSVLANIVLFLALIGAVAMVATGQKGLFSEEVIQDGPRMTKIAVIRLEGVIDTKQAESVYRQLKMAGEDDRVKGLIVRVNSPGGAVSASDRIYNEIRQLREETGKPVVAFMQGLAASGGYYTSVACDKIVAEPTTITGSIGVIMSNFVLQELLEEKLGIQPVVIKSGRKKDWPSMFQAPTEEQKQYLKDKLIKPAYERFVSIIADERPSLTLAEVRALADGSIYGAEEALNEKLIDEIGYLDRAIEEVMSLAELEDAQVVEYQRLFSFSDILSSQQMKFPKLNKTTLYELCTPELMYLWTTD